MLMYLYNLFGVSLLLTECIEFLAAMFWRMRNEKDFLLLFLVNCITNPVAVYAAWLARTCGLVNGGWQKAVSYLLIEITVVVVEGLIYRQYMKRNKHPFIFSLYLNVISYGMGCLI